MKTYNVNIMGLDTCAGVLQCIRYVFKVEAISELAARKDMEYKLFQYNRSDLSVGKVMELDTYVPSLAQ